MKCIHAILVPKYFYLTVSSRRFLEMEIDSQASNGEERCCGENESHYHHVRIRNVKQGAGC